MPIRKSVFIALAVCGLTAWRVLPGAAPKIDPGNYLEHIKYLASEELKGRATGSQELEKAAEYIARQFRSWGLAPLDGGSYMQAFEVTTSAKLGQGNRLEYFLGNAKSTLRFDDEFRPFNFSSRGAASGQIVFAGYGITAPEYDYDDYAGLDVKGKIVMVLRHEPQEMDEKSAFDGRQPTLHSNFDSKAINAKRHGAVGVIVVMDRAAHKSDVDELEKFGKSGGPNDAGIPFVQVKTGIGEAWVRQAGKDLESIETEIDKDLEPRSFALPDFVRIELATDLERSVKTVHNVAGYLKGETDEYVVIGAHYDHLGLGGQFSMAPASEAGAKTHPGADDNASGTAGVLELARWFSSQPKHKRGIVFLAFAGEEMGLLGSSHYVRNPPKPLQGAVAMLNLDMIGRIREGKVYVGGVGTGEGLRPMLEKLATSYKSLSFSYSDTTNYGSSDHTSFTTGQVPVLFFFSGLHGDYHRPSDTWDKVTSKETVQLLDLVAELSGQLMESAGRTVFVKVRDSGGEGGRSGHASK